MKDNFYKVYYLGQYQRSFFQRDAALDYVVTLVAEGEGYIEDYEILDRSDFPDTVTPQHW